MTKIHWSIWIGIGLIVTLVSSRAELTLFIWIGLAFILIGVIKLIYRFVFTERAPKEETKPTRPTHAQQRILHCPCCMSTAHATDNYCRLCGTPLRHLNR